MNTLKPDDEQRMRDDLDWLAQKFTDISQQESGYFCNTIKEALGKGWARMDARNYAIGKLMRTHPS